MKKHLTATIAVISVFWNVTLCAGVGLAAEKETLKGIDGISVLVEDVSRDLERAGVSSIQIRTDVELRLRQLGVSVVTTDTGLLQPGSPFLYIKLRTMADHDPVYGLMGFTYSLDVSLHQVVRLDRELTVSLLAATWESGSFGVIGISKVKNLRDYVKDHVDRFANDYLAMNPKNDDPKPTKPVSILDNPAFEPVYIQPPQDGAPTPSDPATTPPASKTDGHTSATGTERESSSNLDTPEQPQPSPEQGDNQPDSDGQSSTDTPITDHKTDGHSNKAIKKDRTEVA